MSAKEGLHVASFSLTHILSLTCYPSHTLTRHPSHWLFSCSLVASLSLVLPLTRCLSQVICPPFFQSLVVSLIDSFPLLSVTRCLSSALIRSPLSRSRVLPLTHTRSDSPRALTPSFALSPPCSPIVLILSQCLYPRTQRVVLQMHLCHGKASSCVMVGERA